MKDLIEARAKKLKIDIRGFSDFLKRFTLSTDNNSAKFTRGQISSTNEELNFLNSIDKGSGNVEKVIGQRIEILTKEDCLIKKVVKDYAIGRGAFEQGELYAINEELVFLNLLLLTN